MMPTASFWRLWLIRVAFRLSDESKLGRWAWRLARLFASERTHQALATYSGQLVIEGVARGDW